MAMSKRAMARQAAENPDSVEGIHAQIDEEEAAIKDTTNRILKRALQTEEIGVETAVELRKQGERMKKLDNDVDDFNDQVEISKKVVGSFGCGAFLLECLGIRKKLDPLAEKERMYAERMAAKAAVQGKTKEEPKESAYEMAKRQKAATQIEGQDADDLDQISGVVGRLKGIAQDTHAEVKVQNEFAGKLSEKVEKVSGRLREVNDMQQDLLDD
mmetsp:Transcript_17504/g.41196  ORF Transcript_17504/g.41196 Transcript_17504/m.41196 type:complete len:214 (-) Transcript_17504:65-706(-)